MQECSSIVYVKIAELRFRNRRNETNEIYGFHGSGY